MSDVIKKLKHGKSPGFDYLYWELFNLAHDKVQVLLGLVSMIVVGTLRTIIGISVVIAI